MLHAEEEGFQNDSQTELIELTFIPTFTHKKYQPKTYTHPLKLLSARTPADHSLFINEQLQQELADRFLREHPQQLVYRYQSKTFRESTVSFQSNFQGGNLEYVLETGPQRYELYLKADSNTRSHFQWYYFLVKNKQARRITITLKNLLKPALYRQGLKPYYRSRRSEQPNYVQLLQEINFERSEEENGSKYYELTFEFSFVNMNDEVQFCSQPPYSFSRIERLVKNLPFSRVEIAKSLLGHKIEVLLVNEHTTYRGVIVVIARQHPGQPVGSWMMEGLINRLKVTDNPYLWIILPMTNVDGVIMGNNRTGLLGYDYNRNWLVQEESHRTHLFPEIVGLSRFLRKRKRDFGKKIKLFIDFHGHSSQQNVFAYGPPHAKTSDYFENSRLFPYLISLRNQNFSFQQCSYQIESQKKHCSRSVFFHRFGFPYSYTIESSFGIYRDKSIGQADLLRMGEDICSSIIDFMGLINDQKDQKDNRDNKDPKDTKDPKEAKDNKDNRDAFKEIQATRLKQLMGSMRKEITEHSYSNAYDSDSSEEDQNQPIRLEFERKVSSILAQKEKPMHSIRNMNQEASAQISLRRKREHTQQSQSNRYNADLINRPKAINERVKTQELRDKNIKSPQRDRKNSLYLPKLPPNPRFRQQTTSSPQRLMEDCDLNNLSLQEMKQRLFNLKHSKLGKRILILEGYQNS